MKRFVSLFALALLAASSAVAQPELIVRPQDDAASLIERLSAGNAAKAQARKTNLFDGVQSVRPITGRSSAKSSAARSIPAFVLQVADSSAFRQLLQRWSSRAEVAYAQPNYTYQLDGPAGRLSDLPRRSGDPLADSLSHLDVIRARQAWSITTGTPTVRVGLVDTGLMLDHPDLQPQLWINPGEDLNGNAQLDDSDFNGIDDDGNGLVDDIRGYDFVNRTDEVQDGDYRERDPDPSFDPLGRFSGHATSVAGPLIAARGNDTGIAGVAPGTRLVPLRAFGGDGRGATDDIAAAILYAADVGLDVINLSFGRDYAAPLLREAVRYATDRGTVVVASAGNNGGDNPHYPSDYPEVVSVAWLTSDGATIAGRGEFGVGIDLGAPGTAIYTTTVPPDDAETPDVRQLYGRRSGSSMAAPQVAGAAALLRSVDATLSPAAIQSILTASATDLQVEGWDHTTAAGRLNVEAALRQALPARTEIMAPDHDSGTAAAETPVIGSALDPSFASFAVYYARGTEDLDRRPDPWVPITEPVAQQRNRDTLATWRTGALEEGAYTLRLVTTLQSGRTIEDRRRVYIDRSPPVITPSLLQVGLVKGGYGLVADVETDDVTTLAATVTLHETTERVASAVKNRRHGIHWADASGRGGDAAVRLTATNPAGLSTVLDTTIVVPANRANSAFFRDEALSIPEGYLLPRATDFDGDGLLEVVLNPYQNGALGDTLVAYEWDGAGFQRAAALAANVIPRDVGDTNGNGQLELLTQVSGATLLLEQAPGEAFPRTTLFVDTLGLRDPDAPSAVWGGRLTDLDQDGRGEILSHNQSAWRPLEEAEGTYRPIATLTNPTDSLNVDPNVDANAFQQPEAVVEDFDGDGRMDVLVGDSDGDWIVYESTGDNAFRTAWTHETTRVNGGDRFGHGDWDGDGDVDFVTYAENLKIVNDDGAREPPVGLYYFWSTTGNDQYTLMDVVPVQGNVSRLGAIQQADFDGDGRDEVAIIHPPYLYLLDWTPRGAWEVLHVRPAFGAADNGFRSVTAVVADFDGNGRPELLANRRDGRVHRLMPQQSSRSQPPPQWQTARAIDSATVHLAWRAPRADSVTVFTAAADRAFDPLTTTTTTTVCLPERHPRRYALRAWYGDEASPLSEARPVRPHAPAVVSEVSYPDARSLELRFTEPLVQDLQPAQFTLDQGKAPEALLPVQGGRGIVLRFQAPPELRRDTLRWHNVTDAEETPVAQKALEVTFPAPVSPTLVVSNWEVLDRQQVALTFNAALNPETATNPANYRLQPRGTVMDIQFDGTRPQRVVVRVRGVVIGATGQESSLEITQMRGANGETLAEEGNTIRLVQPASSLRDVYVYPNPYRASQHGGSVTVAGLPAEATVRIVTAQGALVRVLRETDQDGGITWDLRDESGRPVDAGMYLLRIVSLNKNSVLKKAAIIR